MPILARKDLWVLIILWITFSTLFLAVPSTDIAVSQWFFDAHTGAFPLATSPLIQDLNNLGHSFIFLLAFWPLPVTLLKLRNFPPYQAFLYVIFYTLSVYILVEFGIKEFWLRPRPEQITFFGGHEKFLPIFHSLPHGDFHSFVSGHASVWFGLMAIGYTLYPKRKLLWSAISVSSGLTMGILRICIGKHYLSDIIFAGLFVISSYVILDILVKELEGRIIISNAWARYFPYLTLKD